MGVWAVEYQLSMKHISNVQVLEGTEPVAIAGAAGRGRPVVVVPYSPAHPPADSTLGEWRRVGDLYELEVKPATRPVDALMGSKPEKR